MANQFRACSVLGCNRYAHRSAYGALGLCCAHYQRRRNNIDMSAPLKVSNEEGIRYLNEIVLRHKGPECLFWPFDINSTGYARITINGKRLLVSHFVCEHVNGRAPIDYEAAHLCGNGHLGCVSPQHMKWKTHTENMADRLIHGTHCRGEKQWNVKLTEAQAREILALRGLMPHRDIAKQYAVSKGTITSILLGKSWAWL
jgi:hypothetical protein